MKAQLGDYIWLYGRRRVIVKIEHTTHGGHCYYGVRLTQDAGERLAQRHYLYNVGTGGWYGYLVYWIRSDRLTLFDGQALRTGESGRPRLEYRLGRNR